GQRPVRRDLGDEFANQEVIAKKIGERHFRGAAPRKPEQDYGELHKEYFRITVRPASGCAFFDWPDLGSVRPHWPAQLRCTGRTRQREDKMPDKVILLVGTKKGAFIL